MLDSTGSVFCGVISQPELQLNSDYVNERALYVLVPLKGELIHSSQIPHQASCHWWGTKGRLVAQVQTANSARKLHT